MKTLRNVFILFIAVLAISSCKDSEDNPVITLNPTTEKILTEGLNIGAYGKDTTVLFPKANWYNIDISYETGHGKWCMVSEKPDAGNGQTEVRIKCAQSDDSLLIERKAKIRLFTLHDEYVINVNQKPHGLAYFKDKVLYIPNKGGDYKLTVLANSRFEVYTLLCTWLTNHFAPIECNEAKSIDIPFHVQSNAGFGRSTSYRISANYYDNHDLVGDDNDRPIIMIVQEPRSFHESETVDMNEPRHYESLETMLGHDSENLSRLKNLTVVNMIRHSDVDYAAKISNLNLDTLNMSQCNYYAFEEERDISRRMFYGCHLSYIDLPKGTDDIFLEAFANCANLRKVSLPTSIEYIGVNAFAHSPKIEEILIPSDSKLRYIEKEAFNTGGTMTSLFIPATTELAKDAFKGLRVKELHIRLATPPTLNPDKEVNRAAYALYVPKGSKGKYMSAPYFKDFGKIVEE